MSSAGNVANVIHSMEFQTNTALPIVAASSTPPTTVPTSPASATETSQPVNSDSTLDVAARAGIGAGVALGVISLIGVFTFLFIFFWRRRRNRQQQQMDVSEIRKSPSLAARPSFTDLGIGIRSLPEDEMAETGSGRFVAEMDASHHQRVDTPHHDQRPELGVTEPVQELPLSPMRQKT